MNKKWLQGRNDWIRLPIKLKSDTTRSHDGKANGEMVRKLAFLPGENCITRFRQEERYVPQRQALQ